MRSEAIAALAGLALLFSPMSAQAPQPLTFEVASNSPSSPGEVNGGIKPLPGGYGYVARNFPLKLMISLMYKIPMRQISGFPEQLSGDRYDIQAKADKPYSVEDLHTMFQSLLAERFGLKFHTETREGPVYFLVVDKPGLKMKPNETPQDFKIPVNPVGAGRSIGVRVPMPYLCWFLSQQLDAQGRAVVDRSGLSGNFDFELEFLPETPPGVGRDELPQELQGRPALVDAIREQLGLRLEPAKGPVETLVIDHIDRPSGN